MSEKEQIYQELVMNKSLAGVAADIIERLYLRHRLGGQEVVITNETAELEKLLNHGWATETARVRRHLDNAVEQEVIIEQQRQLAYMQSVRFTRDPSDADAKVLILTHEYAKQNPPQRHVAYIIKALSSQEAKTEVSNMDGPGVAIIYIDP